jgi:hypothetical protein
MKAEAAIRRDALYCKEPSNKPGEYAGKHTYLHVPFHQKDKAKALGARWDSLARQWYAPAGKDLTQFYGWIK